MDITFSFLMGMCLRMEAGDSGSPRGTCRSPWARPPPLRRGEARCYSTSAWNGASTPQTETPGLGFENRASLPKGVRGRVTTRRALPRRDRFHTGRWPLRADAEIRRSYPLQGRTAARCWLQAQVTPRGYTLQGLDWLAPHPASEGTPAPVQRGAHTAWPGAQLQTLSLGMRCEKGAAGVCTSPWPAGGQDSKRFSCLKSSRGRRSGTWRTVN